MQETILFEAMNAPSRYITTLRYDLSKNMDAETLDRRLSSLFDRHEALRTTFTRDGDGVFWQEVTDRVDNDLFKIESHGGELTIIFHHALVDGWSVGIILRELLADVPPQGRPSPFRYYVKWLGQRNYADDLNWWKEYLDGANADSALPNAARSAEYERRELRFTIQP
jgi:hypothetical protein